jgi:NAD-dependent deacetylase
MTGKPFEYQYEIEAVARILKKCKSAFFITGAGLSADSGLPTYRGVGGLYNDIDAEEDMPIEDLLSGEMILSDPARCWKHIAAIENACRGATFNRGHEVIAKLEQAMPRVWTLTQNVDGFHKQAGAKNVIDIHGDIRNLKCLTCQWKSTVNDYSKLEIPPMCPDCGGYLRPDVVLFGEMLPFNKVELVEREFSRGFDIVFSVGTSSLFPYIASPVMAAHFSGIPTVEINPGITPVSEYVNAKIPTTAALALDALWSAWQALG